MPEDAVCKVDQLAMSNSTLLLSLMYFLIKRTYIGNECLYLYLNYKRESEEFILPYQYVFNLLLLLLGQGKSIMSAMKVIVSFLA